MKNCKRVITRKKYQMLVRDLGLKVEICLMSLLASDNPLENRSLQRCIAYVESVNWSITSSGATLPLSWLEDDCSMLLETKQSDNSNPMATHWKEMGKKLGRILGTSIGFYKEIEAPENQAASWPRTYCLERINHEMQVDVFVCVDERHWILIECRDRRNRTIKNWLHEIKGRASQRQTKLKELKVTGIQVLGVAATSLKE